VRKIAWWLLLAFAFAIPWEYSLDLGEPLGNIARMVGLLLLLAAVPAVLQAGRVRTPGAMQWLVLALLLWFCCTYFWTIDAPATLGKMRAYFQEMMVVWLVWEFAESPENLRTLLKMTVAGCWVLAVLTVVDFVSPESIAAGQLRFAAGGQDPNDVARFLDLGFPLAALLYDGETGWAGRMLTGGYLPVGLVAVLLTASRGGFLAATVALAGCGLLLARGHAKRALAGMLALPAIAAGLWFWIPRETFQRLATITEQIGGGDLNQRWNIWAAGWRAFVEAPIFGQGAGSFVSAAGTAAVDTAHNTALAIAVEGGLCALFLAVAIVAVAAWAVRRTRGTLRMGLATALVVWGITSAAYTVEESRTTWLLLGLIALAGRLAGEDAARLAECFSCDAGAMVQGTFLWSGVRAAEGQSN
jgi:O-antigen ligase